MKWDGMTVLEKCVFLIWIQTVIALTQPDRPARAGLLAKALCQAPLG
jgi:hypothetical protein